MYSSSWNMKYDLKATAPLSETSNVATVGDYE